jgi:hypothetical protein
MINHLKTIVKEEDHATISELRSALDIIAECEQQISTLRQQLENEIAARVYAEKLLMNEPCTVVEHQTLQQQLTSALRDVDYLKTADISALTVVNERVRGYVEKVEKELEALRLEWKTGKPPCDGWYWIMELPENESFGDHPRIAFFRHDDGFFYSSAQANYYVALKWAGPIPRPKEG